MAPKISKLGMIEYSSKMKFFSIGPTPNSQSITCYKFWNQIQFESSMNFKGVQTFLENLINSLKFHLQMIYLNMNLY
jgi:hypothetical protein